MSDLSLPPINPATHDFDTDAEPITLRLTGRYSVIVDHPGALTLGGFSVEADSIGDAKEKAWAAFLALDSRLVPADAAEHGNPLQFVEAAPELDLTPTSNESS